MEIIVREVYHRVWMYSKVVIKFNSDTPGFKDIMTYFKSMGVKEFYSKRKGKLMMYAVDIDVKTYEAFTHWANGQLYQHIQMPKEMLMFK